MAAGGVLERSRASSAPELTGFHEVAGQQMAVVTHAPPGATAGLVLCPSLFTEALRNYRREVVLSRSLAARGIAAQRFHYRGTGNSDDGGDMTFERLCEDARCARELLTSATAVRDVAFLGTRFGALVAAELAAETPAAPLVLIEPVIEARKFFKEGLRAKVMSGFKSLEGASTVAGLVAELEANGAVDVLGDELEWSLYESARSVTLAEAVGTSARPILVIQLGAGDPVRPELDRVVDRWRAAGCAVDVVSLGERSAWWFLDERDPVGAGALRSTGLTDGDPLTEAIVDWLAGHLPKGNA